MYFTCYSNDCVAGYTGTKYDGGRSTGAQDAEFCTQLNSPINLRPTDGSNSVPSRAILTSLFEFQGLRKPLVRKNGNRVVDNHSNLKGLPHVLTSSSVAPLCSLLVSFSLSGTASRSSLSASQNIVPLAESSIILPLGENSDASVETAFGRSTSEAIKTFGANSIAAAGS